MKNEDVRSSIPCLYKEIKIEKINQIKKKVREEMISVWSSIPRLYKEIKIEK